MKTIKYYMPQPTSLSLEQRIQNARKLYVSDLRSVEARFYELASWKLHKYYKAANCEDLLYELLDELSKDGSPRIFADASYAEVADRIYNLYEKGNVDQVVRLMYLFLEPFYLMSVGTFKAPKSKILHSTVTRKCALSVSDYAQVLDNVYPTIRIDLYCYTIAEKTSTLLDMIHSEFMMYNQNYSEDYEKFNESLIKGKYQRNFLTLKELFIDPFHYFWEKTRN